MKLRTNSRLTVVLLVISGIILSAMIFNMIRVNRIDQDPSERSFLKFQRMSGKELHIFWHEKFHNSKYVLDCKIQYNEYNCSTAVIDALMDLGANLNHSDKKGNYINVTGLEKILVEHSYKITRVSNIVGREVVIFKRNSRGLRHAAMVERRMPKSKIMIMEMTGLSGGVNYRTISFKDKRVQAIYPVTRGLWQGNGKR